MVKVIIVYLNDDKKEHFPNSAEVTDGMLVMDWDKKKRRVVINTLNLAWIEIANLS